MAHPYQKQEQRLARQDTIMKKQDQSIDILASEVGDLKSIATEVSIKLDDQKPLIDDLTNHVDAATAKTNRITEKIKTAINDAKDGKSLCCMILLVLIIVGLIVLLSLGK